MAARLIQVEAGQVVAELRLPGGRTIVGRDADVADLVLSHSRISRQHCQFDRQDGESWVVDLGSSNGTRLNGRPLLEPTLLEPGDELELGGAILLTFEEGSGPPLRLIAAVAGGLVLALAVVAIIWLWPAASDPAMQEAAALAVAGVEAHRLGDSSTAKRKLNAAVDHLFYRGRLRGVEELRVREEALRRISDQLPGREDLHDIYQSAVEATRPSFEAPRRLTPGGPCRLDRVRPSVLNLCIRERSELVLAGLWQDPAGIPETFYDAVNHQLRMLLGKRRSWVEGSLERGAELKPMIQAELKQAKVPELLFYLSMIESGYRKDIRSKAGARGLWQFLPSTGRQYGLRVGGGIDDRTDPQKATRAAARYLRDLIFEFGDQALLLAVASYNKGENGVRRALKRLDDPRKDRSYWALVERDLLPTETKEYVPRLIAAAVLGDAGMPSDAALAASR